MKYEHLDELTYEELLELDNGRTFHKPTKRWAPEAGWTTIIGIGLMCAAIVLAYGVIGLAMKGVLGASAK